MIFDMLLLKGRDALLNFGISILYIMKNQILDCKDFCKLKIVALLNYDVE